MLDLNELEKAVLLEMCRRATNESVSLRKQIESAMVINRTNTGAGFYTRLKPSVECTPLSQSIYSNIFVRVLCLKNPMTFVLFTRDGWIDVLEGASVDEGTADIDFATVEFEIL